MTILPWECQDEFDRPTEEEDQDWEDLWHMLGRVEELWSLTINLEGYDEFSEQTLLKPLYKIRAREFVVWLASMNTEDRLESDIGHPFTVIRRGLSGESCEAAD